MQSRTCFEILNLAPTSDYQAVKKQYKALLLAHHPDKGGNTTICQEIIDAFRQINTPEKLAAYYHAMNNNDSRYSAAAAAASVPAAEASDVFASSSRATTQPLNTVVVKGQKIRVFYPLFLAKEYGDNDVSINFDTMLSGCQIDFESVAKVINNCLQPHRPTCGKMVGVDLDDVNYIYHLHSNYKYTRGCYGVEMEVDIVDVIMERLQERENDPYQRDQRGFWRLKEGAQITANNIISLSLVCDNIFRFKWDLAKEYIKDGLNMDVAEIYGVPTFYVDQHRGVDSYQSFILARGIRTQEEVIRQFLCDKSFWKPLTRGHDFPAGIVEMQRSNLTMEALRQIAERHTKEKGRISLFNTQHPLTASFYQCVLNSRTKASIVSWIFDKAVKQLQPALSNQAVIAARP